MLWSLFVWSRRNLGLRPLLLFCTWVCCPQCACVGRSTVVRSSISGCPASLSLLSLFLINVMCLVKPCLCLSASNRCFAVANG